MAPKAMRTASSTSRRTFSSASRSTSRGSFRPTSFASTHRSTNSHFFNSLPRYHYYRSPARTSRVHISVASSPSTVHVRSYWGLGPAWNSFVITIVVLTIVLLVAVIIKICCYSDEAEGADQAADLQKDDIEKQRS